MSQQPYAGRGGRGGGRGGSGMQPQQPYPTYPAAGSAPRPMGAWQPAAPTSMNLSQQPQSYPTTAGQQPPASATAVPPQVPGQPGNAPGSLRGPQMQQQYPPNQAYFNPYAGYNPYYAQQHGGRGPAQQQQFYNPNMPRGQVFYPSQQYPGTNPPQQVNAPGAAGSQTAGAVPHVPVFQPPRPTKKPVVIMDKQGNVLDFSSLASQKKTTPATTSSTAPSASASAPVSSSSTETPAKSVSPAPSSSDAGAKMLQLAQERIAGKVEEKPNAQASTVTSQETKAAAEPAKDAVQPTKSASASNQKQVEAEKSVNTLADRLAAAQLDEAPVGKTTTETTPVKRRVIFTKQQLLSFKDRFNQRPETLPDLTITKIAVSSGQRGGGKGGGRHDRGEGSQKGGGDWSRGSAPPRRESNQGNGKESNQWSRGQAPPPPQQNNRQGSRGGKHNDGPYFDGPVVPLVKSENHWRPKKNSSAFVVAEKQVMSVLNKMTKEKFAKLSEVMVQIPVTSSEILTMMIDRIYDKAIDEPSFGDMYADLCYKLSHSAKVSNFVHIIESDEEPPTEGDATSDRGDSTSNTVYRWSNDVSTSDLEIVGPFDSVEACWEVALSEHEQTPVQRGDMELELVKVAIRRGIFVKIMKKKNSDKDEFYSVYFPVHEAVECGQQMSEIFLSEVECESDANKKNKFKRSLLNKCEEEFNKQDIYADWKKEKETYEQQKGTMTDAERAEKEEDFNFRRIRIKKQMLGNVKFIGQLYKKKLLKERIMRYCITSLLKIDIEEKSTGITEYKDSGNVDIDEEDHEALCSIFTTIGATIDTTAGADFVDTCFTKIKTLSESKSLPSRSRFMYKDLLELRSNRWVPRRKEEKAKTLEEIRKDVEREERLQAQLSAQASKQGFGGSRGGSRMERDVRRPVQNTRTRAKAVKEMDDEGFVTTSKNVSKAQPKSIQTRPNGAPAAAVSSSRSSFAALAAAEESGHDSSGSKAIPGPLDKDKLERRIKSMPIDFMNDNGNVDELLLSFDEISGTPDAGLTLVSKSMDHLCDCKDDERSAIIRIMVLLYEKKRITASNVRDGMAEVIEFIDSIVMDAPKAYEYLGDVLSDMLRIGAVDIPWLCVQLTKCKDAADQTPAPERIISATLQQYKVKVGSDAAKALARSSEPALIKLIGENTLEGITRAL